MIINRPKNAKHAVALLRLCELQLHVVGMAQSIGTT